MQYNEIRYKTDRKRSHIIRQAALQSTGWLAFLLLMLSSCQNELNEESVQYNDNIIRFSTQSSPSRTNNTPSGTKSLSRTFKEGDAFGVFGVYYSSGNTSSQTTAFNNTPVNYWGNSWNCTETKYWKNKNIYKFRAFYPYTNLTSENPEYVLTNTMGDTDSYILKNFIVKDEVTQHSDLMVSDVVTRDLVSNTGTAAHGPVNFTFSHLLTKVNVKLKVDVDRMNLRFKEGWKVTQLYVRLYGMKTKGTCNSGIWDTEASSLNDVGFNKVITNNKDGLFVKEKEILVWSETGENGLLLIPQTDLTQVKCEIGFFIDYTEKGKALKTHINNTSPVPLSTTWENAKQITYVATLDPSNDIKFLAPKVEPWSVSKNSNSVVIK